MFVSCVQWIEGNVMLCFKLNSVTQYLFNHLRWMFVGWVGFWLTTIVYFSKSLKIIIFSQQMAF